MSDDDREWPDPPMPDDPDERAAGRGGRGAEPGPSRLQIRLACASVVFGVLVLATVDSLVEVLAVLWPPGVSLSRWSTLVLLQLFGYVLLPLLVGGWIGDQLYDRWLDVGTDPESGTADE